MRTVFVTLFLMFFFSLAIAVVHAQDCAQIVSVSPSTSSIDINQDTNFNCDVEVDGAHAGSHWIACGVSVNGSWPENNCPSDSNFGGWQGTTARFNCSIPAGSLSSSDVVNIVGFDFSGNCGPDGGKQKQIAVSGSSSQPSNPSQPRPTSSQQNPQNPSTQQPSTPPRTGDICANFRYGLKTCQNNLDCMLNFLKEFLKQSNSGSNGGATPNQPSSPNPAQPPTSTVYSDWLKLYNEVFEKTGVPPGFLKAIREHESGTYYNNIATFQQYMSPGTVMPESICVVPIVGSGNCGERGPMQMTTEKDGSGNTSCPNCSSHRCVNSWKNVAAQAGSLSGNGSPSACNIRDNVYGAALLLKKKMIDLYGSEKWDDDTALINTLKAYAGFGPDQCGPPAPYFGGGQMSFCQFMLCNVHQTC